MCPRAWTACPASITYVTRGGENIKGTTLPSMAPPRGQEDMFSLGKTPPPVWWTAAGLVEQEEEGQLSTLNHESNQLWAEDKRVVSVQQFVSSASILAASFILLDRVIFTHDPPGSTWVPLEVREPQFENHCFRHKKRIKNETFKIIELYFKKSYESKWLTSSCGNNTTN